MKNNPALVEVQKLLTAAQALLHQTELELNAALTQQALAQNAVMLAQRRLDVVAGQIHAYTEALNKVQQSIADGAVDIPTQDS